MGDVSGSTDSSYLKSGYVTIGCGVIAVVLYSVSYGLTSKFLGSADQWQDIQSSVPSILGTAIAASVMLFIAIALYINQMENEKYIIFIVLAMACMSLCFSYTSIAFAVMNKA